MIRIRMWRIEIMKTTISPPRYTV
uniref:Uncharacterized protein n=1 Tax=Arundo donax TaxID=35708 RepID=A0A0A9GCQ9_ARUDO